MSGGHSTYTPKTGIEKWVDERLPLPRLVYDSFVAYPTPRNLNYMYTFGGILSFMLGRDGHHRLLHGFPGYRRADPAASARRFRG
ncbi:hypothetical protein B998_01788 [Brucella sp. F96/2]|nr:cytochrome b [Brucella ceti B1/94]EEZ09103.1 cytochrome b [Brucella ceti M490/95/1]ENT08328.1 hypothetical protein C983_01422 [Brucella sp. F23/97]ENT16243.1 hypothetical protein B998_01788 [Brucella sp. F96/2]ENT21808.1 hypothetical protein C065_01418 [Brucella sp. UK1/97]